MEAKKIKATVIENVWLTPNVISLKFESNKKLNFQPGQFLSLYIPSPEDPRKTVRRAYSFANSPENSKVEGYEICAKYHPTGVGTNFLRSLRPGDTFEATAPYGDFQYNLTSQNRSVCFIATGTGIAPFKSMLLSEDFQKNPPQNILVLFGVRHENEILFQSIFQGLGVDIRNCVSQPTPSWAGFKGRVTDMLKTIPHDWLWHTTDFYICGNSDMINETRQILVGGHGVSDKSIFQEAFFMKPGASKRAA